MDTTKFEDAYQEKDLVLKDLSLKDLVLSVLHNLIQQSLNSGSVQVQILLAACQRFAVVRISDNGPGWK